MAFANARREKGLRAKNGKSSHLGSISGAPSEAVSYSGIVTRVFTWFLIIYFTILIITRSKIIKLDRGNNEGRKNK